MTSLAPSLTQQLEVAGKSLSRVCDLLLSPTPGALDECAILLAATVTKVTACQTAIAGPRIDPGASAEGRRLQATLRRARRLLDSAALYHQNWARRLGAMTCGYNGHGEPAALDRGRRMIARG